MRRLGSRLSLHGLSKGLQGSAWPAGVLIILALGLLLAFHQVTRSSVQQSELRWQITNEYYKATRHCNSLSGPRARKKCLSERTLIASNSPAQQP